jgi:hypothetical protein
MPPAPGKSADWLWWILGFAGAAVILCIVGGLAIARLVVKNVRVGHKEQQVEVSTPVGDFSVTSTPVKDVGLPVYPGATPVESGKNVELGFPEEEGVGIAAVKYCSSDPLGKVDAWYREHLGPEFRRETGDKNGKIRVHGIATEGVAYVAEKGDGVRVVAMSKKLAGIEIALLRIGKRMAQ